MRTDQKTVGKLLQGQTQFLVPVFQRPYVWKITTVQRLWQDIRAVNEDAQTSHFLGSIVITPSPVPSSMDRWIVVDGQQRLTTLSILFCALRDHARGIDDQFADKIDDLYLINKYYDGDGRSKLLPSAADQPSWWKLLRSHPEAGGSDRLGEAYRFFRSALLDETDAVDGGDHSVELAALERAVANQLHLVEIRAESDDNVHRIFESLNARGEPLRQADLLRNYVFMRLPHRWVTVNDQYWAPTEEIVGDRLEHLIRLNLVLAGQTHIRHGDVYQALQARLQALPDEPSIEAWVVQLHQQARVFRRVVDPTTEADPTVRAALTRLHEWGSAAAHVIAVHILTSHDAGQLTAAEAAEALRMVESYLVRRYLLDVPSSNNARNLAALVKDLGPKPPTAAAIRQLLSRVKREFPSDEQVREFVLNEAFYPGSRAPKVYLLRCIEESYAHRERVDLGQVKLTIEHVLPQHPSPPWWDMLQAEASAKESAEDIHTALVHTMGNLTLTAYNAELDNDPFEVKRQILADSGLSMNREIAKNARWGKAEIQARGAALAERIIAIWPGPLSPSPSPSSSSPSSSSPSSSSPSSSSPSSPSPSSPSPSSPSASARQRAVPAGSFAAAGPAGSTTAGRRRPPATRPAKRLTRLLTAIPAGRWTSFSELGKVLGCHQTRVGSLLLDYDFPNAHRVLKKRGAASDKAQQALLKAEGVTFDPHDRAVAELCMSAEELSRAIERPSNDWASDEATTE